MPPLFFESGKSGGNRPWVSAYLAMSLDGFIARKPLAEKSDTQQSALDWLDDPRYRLEDNPTDCGYARFLDSVDVLLMGRNTFELVGTFETWPYAEKSVKVLTRRPVSSHPYVGYVETLEGEPNVCLVSLYQTGARHVYVDGGDVVRQFLNARLLDQLVITVIPTLLGDGIRLFESATQQHNLTLQSHAAYANGFVQLCYGVLSK